MDDLYTGQLGADGVNAESGISIIDGDAFRPSLRRSATLLPSINSIFRPEALLRIPGEGSRRDDIARCHALRRHNSKLRE